jgi:mRNA interferase HigB
MSLLPANALICSADNHLETRSALALVSDHQAAQSFTSFADLRSHFPSADQVGKLTVFNIGGNKVV